MESSPGEWSRVTLPASAAGYCIFARRANPRGGGSVSPKLKTQTRPDWDSPGGPLWTDAGWMGAHAPAQLSISVIRFLAAGFVE
jgi:hypothetical protein